MNYGDFLELSKSIAVGFPNSFISRWVSHDDHEEIEIYNELGTAKIMFYPKEVTK